MPTGSNSGDASVWSPVRRTARFVLAESMKKLNHDQISECRMHLRRRLLIQLTAFKAHQLLSQQTLTETMLSEFQDNVSDEFFVSIAK